MAAIPEDQSFLIYVSIRKGYTVSRASNVTAIVHKPTGGTASIELKDNGICMFF